MKNILDDLAIGGVIDVTGGGHVWTPRRPGSSLSGRVYELEQEIQRVRRKGPQRIDTTSGAALRMPAGIPKQIISCTATESPSTQVDRSFSQVAVSFTRDPSDPNFAGVHIWFTGYKGNSQPVLMTDAADSPAIFLCETTKENVTVTVQPFNGGHVAAPFAGAKTCSVALDGVTSAPPAPSVASLTAAVANGATTLGQQFTFNQLPASNAYAIAGYWVYRAGSSTTPVPPSGRLKFLPANQNQQGAIVVTDLSGVSTNYFWVSAVDKTGLESPLSAAGTSGGGGGGATTTTYRPSSSTLVSGSNYGSPANVYDGNASTWAQASPSSSALVWETSWQGWSTFSGSPTSVKLKVTSQVNTTSGANVKLEYSTDGGTTWTTIYNVTASRAQTTDVVTLANATVGTSVKIRGTATSNGSSHGTHSIFEAWIEVTT